MRKWAWLACVGLLAVAVFLPVGTGLSRRATVVLASLVWSGVLVWSWPRPALRSAALADPGLVREALDLWWHDRSASTLGAGRDGVTSHVVDAGSVDALDAVSVVPGDLAVTRDGVHVLAHVGGREWIAADPGLGRVVTLAAPSPDNPWFHVPVSIVRWRVLAGDR